MDSKRQHQPHKMSLKTPEETRMKRKRLQRNADVCETGWKWVKMSFVPHKQCTSLFLYDYETKQLLMVFFSTHCCWSRPSMCHWSFQVRDWRFVYSKLRSLWSNQPLLRWSRRTQLPWVKHWTSKISCMELWRLWRCWRKFLFSSMLTLRKASTDINEASAVRIHHSSHDFATPSSVILFCSQNGFHWILDTMTLSHNPHWRLAVFCMNGTK